MTSALFLLISVPGSPWSQPMTTVPDLVSRLQPLTSVPVSIHDLSPFLLTSVSSSPWCRSLTSANDLVPSPSQSQVDVRGG
jgi:hypothetical protein